MKCRSRAKYARLSLAVVVVSLASGCSGAEQSAEPDSRRVIGSDATDDAGVQATGVFSIPAKLRPKPTPIEAYLGTARQLATLDYAQQILAATCMQEHGYKIQVVKFDDLVAWRTEDVEYTRSRWFGLTDLGAAKKFGYGEPPLTPEPTVDNSKVLSDPLAAEAWDGSADLTVQLSADDEANGCNRGSQMKLLGVSGLDLTQPLLAEQLRNDATARAQATPEYAAVYEDFGQCLRDAGYDVPDPQRPFASKQLRQINNGRDRAPGERAPSAEIKLAAADIDCKVKTNFVRRLEAVLTDEQRSLIEQNALALDEEQERTESALRRAASVIDGDGGDKP